MASAEVQYGPPDAEGRRWKLTPPEMELQWAEQDYRIAVQNLAEAERRHELATEQYNDAVEAVTKARTAVRSKAT